MPSEIGCVRYDGTRAGNRTAYADAESTTPVATVIASLDSIASAWPLLPSREVLERDVMTARLHGNEFAVWRDDGGGVNVWEDRCPHRGVRLSLGTNTGSELKCRYHGWRYASGSARCTFVPAQPEREPPVAARVVSMTAVEKYGFIWLLTDEAARVPAMPALEGGDVTTLRSVTIHAPAEDVRRALASLRSAGEDLAPVFFVLPECNSVTTVHGACTGISDPAERRRLRVAQNERLMILRASLERRAAVYAPTET